MLFRVHHPSLLSSFLRRLRAFPHRHHRRLRLLRHPRPFCHRLQRSRPSSNPAGFCLRISGLCIAPRLCASCPALNIAYRRLSIVQKPPPSFCSLHHCSLTLSITVRALSIAVRALSIASDTSPLPIGPLPSLPVFGHSFRPSPSPLHRFRLPSGPTSHIRAAPLASGSHLLSVAFLSVAAAPLSLYSGQV